MFKKYIKAAAAGQTQYHESRDVFFYVRCFPGTWNYFFHVWYRRVKRQGSPERSLLYGSSNCWQPVRFQVTSVTHEVWCYLQMELPSSGFSFPVHLAPDVSLQPSQSRRSHTYWELSLSRCARQTPGQTAAWEKGSWLCGCPLEHFLPKWTSFY